MLVGGVGLGAVNEDGGHMVSDVVLRLVFAYALATSGGKRANKGVLLELDDFLHELLTSLVKGLVEQSSIVDF